MKLLLDTEKKLILIVSLFIITIIGIYLIIVWPTISQIKTINKDTQNIKEYLERRHQNVMGIKNSQIKINEIREDVSSFINYFYFNEQELKLITNLEEIAHYQNVDQKINNYEIKNNNVILSMDISGDYKDVINYLNELEKINYFININFLHLTKNLERNKTITKLRLELNLYVNSK